MPMVSCTHVLRSRVDNPHAYLTYGQMNGKEAKANRASVAVPNPTQGVQASQALLPGIAQKKAQPKPAASGASVAKAANSAAGAAQSAANGVAAAAKPKAKSASKGARSLLNGAFSKVSGTVTSLTGKEFWQ